MAKLEMLPVDKIRIPDVRVSSIMNEEQKALLSSTIQEVGVIQDPVVRGLPDGSYELISGRSRIQEQVNQGATEVQVKVIEASESLGLIMNIVENVARGTYDYISISRAIRRLKALGKKDEDLEKIFPWRRRWIKFVEELQDLPDDVVEAITTKKLTPTHVQLALNLPTPFEVHDGLRTAVNLGWDTGTFKVFVENRVEQIARAKENAELKGVEAEIPPPQPQQLIAYKMCLTCGYKKPSEKVTVQFVCDGCKDLLNYLTGQLGTPEEAMDQVYRALKAYYGQRDATPGPPVEPTPGASQG